MSVSFFYANYPQRKKSECQKGKMFCQLLYNFLFSKMSDYEDIDTEMDNLDDMMEDHDVFEDNDEVRNFF